MKFQHLVHLGLRGVGALWARRPRPLVGTVILGDRCNLSCAHCGVGNLHKRLTPYAQVRRDLELLRRAGVRLLFFCGGETWLWSDGDRSLRDLVLEAKGMGFYAVNVVTNGTLGVSLPEADLVLLSLDGIGAAHDRIRGEGCFAEVMRHLDRADAGNTCLYSAVNAWNLDQIRPLGEFARRHPNVRCLSFNFHTPYPGTEALSLSPDQRREAVEAVRALLREGFPVFNLEVGLDHWLRGDWSRPCSHCVVVEEGEVSTCGRCIHIPGLCEACGYLFAVEFTLIFQGRPRALLQMLRTYPRYV